MPAKILRTWRFIGEETVLSLSECSDRTKVLVQAEPSLNNPHVDEDEEFWVLLNSEQWQELRGLDPFNVEKRKTRPKARTLHFSDSQSESGDVLEIVELPLRDTVQVIMRRANATRSPALVMTLDRAEWNVLIELEVLDSPRRAASLPSSATDADDVVH